jgi:hypothetical protein
MEKENVILKLRDFDEVLVEIDKIRSRKLGAKNSDNEVIQNECNKSDAPVNSKEFPWFLGDDYPG